MVEPSHTVDPLARRTTPTPRSELKNRTPVLGSGNGSRFYDPRPVSSTDPYLDEPGAASPDWDAAMPSSNRRRPHSARRGQSIPQPAQQHPQQSQPPPPAQYSPYGQPSSGESSAGHLTHFYSSPGAPGYLGPQYTIPHQSAQAFTPPPFGYTYDISGQNYLQPYSYDQRSSTYPYHQPSPPPPGHSPPGPSTPAQNQPQYGSQNPGPPQTYPSSPYASGAGSPSTFAAATQSPTYSGQGAYQTLRFSPPMPPHSSQYGYGPPHSFSSPPPLYSPSYASYSSPQDGSQAGTWWYLPPAAQQQYEAEQAGYYAAAHQMSQQQPYPSLSRQDHDNMPTASSSSALLPHAQTPLQSPGPSSAASSLRHQQHPLQSSHPATPSRPDSAQQQGRSERPAVRRPHHPNPPAYRSEWVMWVGNVPPDATHDELWRFFSQMSPSPASSSTSSSTHLATASSTASRTSPSQLSSSASPAAGLSSPRAPSPSAQPSSQGAGLLSIFLISRSSCAFVNLASEAHLRSAISRFNGVSLRPQDLRVPKLVCRVRRKDDDLKAGVGGQRGIGLHSRWIKEKAKAAAASSSGASADISEASESSASLSEAVASLSISDDDYHASGAAPSSAATAGPSSGLKWYGGGSGSSGSYASTNSSFLVKYYPKRYFILKSLTQFDLDLSVEKGLWATQKHNEGILDKAYRTSKEVYLIFGVNKSGEFYGYARMAGPILHGEEKVSWAARTTDSSSSARSSLSLSSPITGRGPLTSEVIPEEGEREPSSSSYRPAGDTSLFFSPTEHPVQESPQPVQTPEMHARSGLATSSPSERRVRPRPRRPLPPHAETTDAIEEHGVDADEESEHEEDQAEEDEEAEEVPTHPGSAPAELGPRHKAMTSSTISSKLSLDVTRARSRYPNPPPAAVQKDLEAAARERVREFELDKMAPLKRLRGGDRLDMDDGEERSPISAGGRKGSEQLGAVSEEDEAGAGGAGPPPFRRGPGPSSLQQSIEASQHPQSQQQGRNEDSWGEPFRVDWLCTTRLPFHRTRHVRNPWNHDREVKVSRDGTEIEPSVGQMLIDEWMKDPTQADGASEKGGGGGAGASAKDGAQKGGAKRGGGAGGGAGAATAGRTAPTTIKTTTATT